MFGRVPVESKQAKRDIIPDSYIYCEPTGGCGLCMLHQSLNGLYEVSRPDGCRVVVTEW